MKRSIQTRWVLVASWMLMTSAALAQESGPKVIPEKAEGVTVADKTGWNPYLKLNANFALGQSKNSPGAPDGVSLQLGYIINAKLDYLSPTKRHEWATGLGLELAFTRTPVVDTFIKSVDKIDFRSAYLFHIPKVPWLGPFVAFRLSTPMLQTHLVQADPASVIRLERDEELALDAAGNPVDGAGNPIDANHPRVTNYESGGRIKLTEAFSPLTLRESVGLFAIPLDQKAIKLDSRLGFGAWETFVNDGFTLDDNDATADLLELRRMQDSVQLGPELGVIVSGAAKEFLTYRASALFMHPVYHNAETDLKGTELTNMEFEVGMGFKITKYLAIDYSFKAYRQPLIIDAWQIQNNLLLSVGFELPTPPPPPPACPPAPECPTCPTTAPAAAPEAPPAAPAPEAVSSESPSSPATEKPTAEAAPERSGTAPTEDVPGADAEADAAAPAAAP